MASSSALVSPKDQSERDQTAASDIRRQHISLMQQVYAETSEFWARSITFFEGVRQC